MSIRLDRVVTRLGRENAMLRDELATAQRWAKEYQDGYVKALAKIKAMSKGGELSQKSVHPHGS